MRSQSAFSGSQRGGSSPLFVLLQQRVEQAVVVRQPGVLDGHHVRLHLHGGAEPCARWFRLGVIQHSHDMAGSSFRSLSKIQQLVCQFLLDYIDLRRAPTLRPSASHRAEPRFCTTWVAGKRCCPSWEGRNPLHRIPLPEADRCLQGMAIPGATGSTQGERSRTRALAVAGLLVDVAQN